MKVMLKTKHVFPFIKMIRALDIKTELKAMFAKAKGKTKEELEQLDEEEGIEYLFIFIDKLPNAEREVMDFLTLYTEKTRKELDEQDIEFTFETIKGIVMDEKFQAFFQLAMKQSTK
jgi:acyl-CoA reductase-like NAD-dependent aldehyde dehydrogenase